MKVVIKEESALPISYGYKDGIIRTQLLGRVTDDDLVEYYRRSEFDEIIGQWLEIIDGRSAGIIDVTPSGMQRLANLAKLRIEQLRGGIVAMVASEVSTFGMFRVREVSRDYLPYTVKVFHQYEEAVQWVMSTREKNEEFPDWDWRKSMQSYCNLSHTERPICQ